MPLQINSKAVIDASFGSKRVVAMMLNNALVWQRSTRRLPIGYTELEWLNTNKGYLYTGITFEKGTTIEQVVKFTNSGKRDLLGWRANATWYWGVDASNRFELGGTYVIPIETANPLEWHKVAYRHTGSGGSAFITIDDNITLERSGAAAYAANAYDFTSDSNRGEVYFKTIKKISPDGTVTNNQVPALRDSDNAVGFYDLITKEFRACEKAIAGPALYLPSTYTEVEYIESTGTQYIDTGIIGKTGEYKVRTKIRTSSDISSLQPFYGVRKDSGNTRFLLGFYTYVGAVQFDMAINTDFYGKVVEPNTKYELEADYISATRTLKIDRNIVAQSTESIDTGGNIFLFGYNRIYQPAQPTQYSFKGRMYNWEAINANDEHLANYVSCIRNSDGAVSMYDKVTNTFMPPKGTGAFIAGPIKQ